MSSSFCENALAARFGMPTPAVLASDLNSFLEKIFGTGLMPLMMACISF